MRERLHAVALRWKCNIDESDSLPSLCVRRSSPGALPVLCMTLSLATAVITGQKPSPDEGTLFFTLGRTVSNVVPLGLVACPGCTRFASVLGYAFKAGWW